MEQLLHATAHAQRLPALDALLLSPSLPQSKRDAECFIPLLFSVLSSGMN